MAFNYDPSTPIGKLRLAIGDTDQEHGVRPSGEPFMDEELDLFLVGVDDWHTAVPAVLTTLANQYASQIGSERFGPYAKSNEQRAKELRIQAREWERNWGASSHTFASSGEVPIIATVA